MQSESSNAGSIDREAILTRLLHLHPQEMEDEVICNTVKKDTCIDIRKLDFELADLLAPFIKYASQHEIASKEVMKVNTFRLSLSDTQSWRIVDIKDEMKLMRENSFETYAVDGRAWLFEDINYEEELPKLTSSDAVLFSMVTGLISFNHVNIRHLDLNIAIVITGFDARQVYPITDFNAYEFELLSRLSEHFPNLRTINFAVDNRATVLPPQHTRYYDGIPGVVGRRYLGTWRCTNQVFQEMKLWMLHTLLVAFAVKLPASVKRTVTFTQCRPTSDSDIMVFSGETFVPTVPFESFDDETWIRHNWFRLASMNCEIMDWPKTIIQQDIDGQFFQITDAEIRREEMEENQGLADLELICQMLSQPRSIVRLP